MRSQINTLAAIGTVTVSIAVMNQATAVAHEADVQQNVVPSEERGTDLDVTVWYPASSGAR